MHYNKNEVDSTRKGSTFASIKQEYKNIVFSSEHSIVARDVFCTYLHRGLKKPDNITPIDFKAHFKVLFKLYNNLKADNELTIGFLEDTLLSFNPFSAEHCNVFVQQQKQYNNVVMDDFMDFF